MRLLFSLLMILLSSCTLAENRQPEESKDYTGTIHNVEQANFEFEERLNSFYDSEVIDIEDLYDMYGGEFPEGERNPQKLRIYWKDARELALAEVELQKEIQTGWDNTSVSERPILVLDDKGSKKFYRYYEYRVVEGDKYLGAIRIPAYRRTENFATAAVHVYSADEKTYTVQPTGWGQYMAENSELNQGGSFYSMMLEDVFVLLQNKNFAFNWYYRSFENQYLINNATEPISKEKAYSISYDKLYEMVRKVDLPTSKTTIGEEHLNYMASAMAQDSEQELADTMTDIFRFYSTAQTIAKITDQYDASYLSGVFMNSYTKIYKNTVDIILTNMSHSQTTNIIRDALKLIFWEILDDTILSKETDSYYKYLLMSWGELGNELTKKNIFPKIEYPNLNVFPLYKNNSNIALRYKYITTQEFNKGQEFIISFINGEETHKVSWEQEHITFSQFTEEFKMTNPDFIENTKKAVTYNASISHSDIDVAINETYEILAKYFPDKSEQQLKSEISSIIYAQADPKLVYYRYFGNSFVDSQSKNIFYQRNANLRSTLPTFPDWDINDVLDNVIDNLGQAANKQTIGIWFASGLACKNMSDEMKSLNEKISELTELYNFLANDYENVLNQVYEKALTENSGDAAAAKIARDKFQGQIKILESIVREGDVGEGIKRAMKLMVKKWLVWYVPIFPWPMGHWITYATGYGGGVSLSDMEKGYAQPINDLTLPLALAVSWVDMDNLPVSRPSDVDESLYAQDVPENIKKNNLESEWKQAWLWFEEQDIVQGNSADNRRDIYQVFEGNISAILAGNYVYGYHADKEHRTEEFYSQFTNRERRLELERWLNNWMYINNDPNNTEIIPEGGYYHLGYTGCIRTGINRFIVRFYTYGSSYVSAFQRDYEYTPFKLTNDIGEEL